MSQQADNARFREALTEIAGLEDPSASMEDLADSCITASRIALAALRLPAPTSVAVPSAGGFFPPEGAAPKASDDQFQGEPLRSDRRKR